ncbi:glycosyltransferase family 9 protein [Orrella sp. JC864]|uniref:glycosyltransferase family 9 protein n=1 Tax=Orrella sp. JC864 TaxID=3120298 RepID=UPI0012BB528F
MTADIVVFLRSKKFFGSQIVAFPALYQIKQCWPGHRLRVVAQDDVGHYYRPLPWVDEFVQTRGLRTNLAVLAPQTRAMVALHHTSEQYALIACLKRPPLRLGYRNGRVGDFAWTHACDKRLDEYIGLSYMNLLRTVHAFDPVEAARRCFAEVAALAREQPRQTDVVLVPGGGHGAYKRWGVDNFLKLAEGLKARLGRDTTFSFVLGPVEQEAYRTLQALNRPDFSLLMSRPYPELAHLMARARLVVANDCGPSHLAQGTGVPYVGIFHRSNPQWFWVRPNARKVIPENEAQGIRSIPPERVLQACLSVLRAPAALQLAPSQRRYAPAAVGDDDMPSLLTPA